MIHPNEKPCLVQGKIRFPALVLGLVFLFFPVSADTKTFQTELDFKLKSLVRHGSVLIADKKDILYRYPAEDNPMLVGVGTVGRIPAPVLASGFAASNLCWPGETDARNVTYACTYRPMVTLVNATRLLAIGACVGCGCLEIHTIRGNRGWAPKVLVNTSDCPEGIFHH